MQLFLDVPNLALNNTDSVARGGYGFMLGRYQPFHAGHFNIFKAILAKHPKGVVIGIRDCPPDAKNPDRPGTVLYNIQRFMETMDVPVDKYTIIVLPDIQGIYYGRDVGYAIEKIELPPELQAISASKVRNGEINVYGEKPGQDGYIQ